MKNFSRREFIRLSTIAIAGAGIAACAPTAPPATAPTTASTVAPTKAAETTKAAVEPTKAAVATDAPAVVTSAYKEAPMLAALVAAGKLPPVDQRLPINPKVTAPADGFMGKYGGVIRAPYGGWGYRWHVRELIKETERVLFYDENMNLVPWMVESYEISPDATTYTVHLRAGAKWSDGNPLTSADFKWTYDNYINTEGLAAGTTWKGSWQQKGPDGAVLTADLETPDDMTVVVKYKQPEAFGARKMSDLWPLPSEYMKEFHPDTTSDKAKLDKDIADAGFKTWQDFFDNQGWYALNPDFPIMGPWKADKTKMPAEIFVVTRNPYYSAVDPEGNQLPYIDQYQFRLFEKWDTAKLWMLNGEVDLWPEVGLGDVQTFQGSAEKGKFNLVKNSQAAHTGIQLNLTTKDARLAEFFGKRDVRIAISHAINRQEANDLLTLGLAIPRQYSPVRASPNYYEKLTTAYTDFDLDKANDLLDGAGYTEKNTKGLRLWPGTQEPISWILEESSDPGTLNADTSNLVKKYMSEVGLTMDVKPVARTLYDEHTKTNDVQAAQWGGDRCFMPVFTPSIFLGEQIDRPWAIAWGLYHQDPTMKTNPAAVKPPEDHWINDIWAIWEKIKVEPDDAKKNDLFTGILDIWAAELPMIGIVGDWVMHTYVHNGLKNVKPGTVLDWGTSWLALLPLETLSYEDPETQSVGKVIA